VRSFAKRHSLLLYFVLTFAIFWVCLALGRIERFRFFVPVAGALAPGVAALLLTGVAEGEDSVRALLRRLTEWRVNPLWYLVVLGLPLTEAFIAIGVASFMVAFSVARMSPVMPALMVAWVMFLFAAVEELGWRGFALPRLLDIRSALAASLILGVLHAVRHWPMIILQGGHGSNSIPLLTPRLLRGSTFIVAEAVLFTWIFRNTRGSLLMATLYHGVSNAAVLLYQGVDQARIPWLRPSISVAMAGVVIFVTGPDLLLKRARDRAHDELVHDV